MWFLIPRKSRHFTELNVEILAVFSLEGGMRSEINLKKIT